MRVLVVTPPSPSLDLQLVKKHLRLDHPDDDDLVEAYVAAACSHIDGPRGILGRSMWAQTLEVRLPAFGAAMRLPCGPVQSVASVRYFDPDGVEQTLAAPAYVLSDDRVFLAHGASWPDFQPGPESIRIRYAAGGDELPKAVEQALLLLIGHWFANREAVNVGNITSELPVATRALLAPYVAWAV